MDDDLDYALAERLDRFYGDILVARTMRTPKMQEQWTNAAVQRAVADIKRLCREGVPPKSSPFTRTRRGLGLMQGEGQGGPRCASPDGSSTAPELRLVE